MHLSEWFSYQLKSSGDGFVWAVEQVPVEHRESMPPDPLGEWPMVRHIVHMLRYERSHALPYMKHWLGGSVPSEEEMMNQFQAEEEKWQQHPGVEQLLTDFQRVRAEQIALLPSLDEALWNETRPSVWGSVNMRWVVTKTVQHTAEHTHDVLCMALFWDGIVARQKAESK